MLGLSWVKLSQGWGCRLASWGLDLIGLFLNVYLKSTEGAINFGFDSWCRMWPNYISLVTEVEDVGKGAKGGL